MKKGPVFLGVYSKIPLAGDDGAEGLRRWHVWSLENGQFLIQEILAGKEEPKEPRRLHPADFFSRYRVSAAFGTEDKGPLPQMPKLESAPEKTAQPPRAPARNIFDDLQDGYGRLESPDQAEDGEGGALYPLREKTGKDEAEKNATFYTAKRDAAEEANPLTSDLDRLEKQMRSDFSLALIRLRSSRDKALESLNKILDNTAGFDKKHKFMFSEFGTALRRRKLYSLAFRFHERARTLAPDDEHILFNMARAMFDAGKTDQARKYLQQAVAMARDFQAGTDFLAFIDGENTSGTGKHG